MRGIDEYAVMVGNWVYSNSRGNYGATFYGAVEKYS
jgi:hypothetical protein